MTYIRKKTINGNDYFYIQKTYREGGKVKTKHVKYLGTTQPKSFTGLIPGSVITAQTGKGVLTQIPSTHSLGIASGIGVYMTGLFIFNRQFIKFRKAKAKKEILIQKDVIEKFTNKLHKKYPKISKSRLRGYVKKELEKRYLESEELNKKDRTLKTEFSKEENEGIKAFQKKVIIDYKKNLEKKQGKKVTNNDLFLSLRKKNPDMSEQRIKQLIKENV